MPTYKVAIGTPEFKRIWLSATFVILPFLRHSLYKIMQMNSKFQDFFYFISFEIERFPLSNQVSITRAHNLPNFFEKCEWACQKTFFASFEMLLLPSKIIMIIVIGKPIYYCESNSSRLRILVWSNIKTPIQEVI